MLSKFTVYQCMHVCNYSVCNYVVIFYIAMYVYVLYFSSKEEWPCMADYQSIINQSIIIDHLFFRSIDK